LIKICILHIEKLFNFTKTKTMVKFKNLIEKYSDFFTKKKIEKNILLYETGEPIKKIYYSEKGRTRIYSIYKQGNKPEKEVTRGFFFENEAVIPIRAFTQNIPVFVDIETIDDCVMQVITVADWKKIEKQEPVLIRDVLLDTFDNVLKHFYNYQLINSYDAKIRVKEFFKIYPNLKDIKNEYIASLLGNDPSHFSTIRHKLGL